MSRIPASVARPFIILGETRRGALAAHLRGCVERWRRVWAPTERSAVGVEIPEDLARIAVLRAHDIVCMRASAPAAGQELILLVPGRCVPHLLGMQGDAMEAASHHPDEHSVAGQLVLEALRGLVRELTGWSAGSVDLQRCTTPLAAVLRESETNHLAAALITLSDSKVPLLVLFSPQLASTVLPSRTVAPGTERVERRRRVVGDAVVAIEAVLGHAEVSVSDVAALAVGDVIILEEDLGANGSLVVRGGGHIAGVMPGQVDGKRAIQVRKRGEA